MGHVLFYRYLVSILSLGALSQPAAAQLTFFYDPDTGNVAFDTVETRSGGLHSYGLLLYRDRTEVRFRSVNQIPVWRAATLEDGSEATGYYADFLMSEFSFSQSVEGYFTIGDVLPSGLTPEEWNDLFRVNALRYNHIGDHPGAHFYNDIIGGGGNYPEARFVYGQPDRSYDNRLDYLDPDTLDWATEAVLIYDPLDGSIVIDTSGEDGGHISMVLLQSDGGLLTDGFDPFVESPFNGASAEAIGVVADAVEPGLLGMGNILPAGMSLAEVESTLTSAKFTGRFGFGGSLNLDIETNGLDFQIQMAVPEPATLAIAALACAVALQQTRQRSDFQR